MNPLIIYYSKTGNTHKLVSGCVASRSIDIVSADEVTVDDLKDRSLIGLASGIYWGKHHSSLFNSVKIIPKNTRIFIISSSGFSSPFLVNVYTSLLKVWIRRAQLNLVGLWHCPGHDKSKDPLFSCLDLAKGRPNQNDLKDLCGFIDAVSEKRTAI